MNPYMNAYPGKIFAGPNEIVSSDIRHPDHPDHSRYVEWKLRRDRAVEDAGRKFDEENPFQPLAAGRAPARSAKSPAEHMQDSGTAGADASGFVWYSGYKELTPAK